MEDRILYASKEGMHFYKMEGRITHMISAGFDESLNRIFSMTEVSDVLIDLSHAEFLDSTNLGLLAKIVRLMHSKNLGKAVLISPCREVSVTLDSMGLLDMFEVSNNSQCLDESFSTIESEKLCMNDKGKLLLQTHRELMNLNEKNREAFRNVVSVLEQELSK